MLVPVLLSVNGLFNASFTVWVSGVIDVREYHCSMLIIGMHVLPGHHTASTNLTELWTALAHIWQVIPAERFQKLVESMIGRVAAVIKARGSPTPYCVAILNSVALQCSARLINSL
ncbi:hypothetical protein TNCV_1690011 [Trichonephila clavipes]|nr:hypothetical protein TNCV_1690011 [Trichonephila clavipes]